MARIALVVTYLLGMVFAIISMDAGDDGWLSALWVVASVLLGAGTGDYRFALLSLLAIPIAIPFGLPADQYSDPVLPVWTGALALAPISSALVLFGAFLRRIVEARLRRRRTFRDSGIA
ncbi:MAG TPA: hypothetical protein VI039_00770 [Solirubrobacterales bacterium]